MNNPLTRSQDVSDEELQRQQEEIRQGLMRSQTTTGIALVITIMLALTTVFHAQRAQRSEAAAQESNRRNVEELRNSELARARAWRLSGAVGRREESLKAIRAAAQIRPATDLRHEAIAALALIDIRPGKMHQPVPPQANAYAFSPDLQWYAVGRWDGVVSVAPTHGPEAARQFTWPNQSVASVDFSPDASKLAVRAETGPIQVWDLQSGEVIFAGDFRHREPRPDSVGFHPSSKELAVACEDQRVRIINLGEGQESAPIRTEAAAWTVRYDGTGDRLAVGVGNYIHVYESASRIKIHSFNMGDGVSGLTWYPDGERLAAYAPFGRIMLVDIRTGSVKHLSGHTSRATGVFCDPTAQLLLSASWDGTTRFWDAGSGRPLLVTQTGFARGVDPLGKRIGFYREGVEVGDWEILRSEVFSKLALPWNTHWLVQAIAWSPDGRCLAACVMDRIVLLEAATGRFLAETRLPRPFGVAFSPDGRSLASSSEQGVRRMEILTNELGQVVQLGDPLPYPGVPEAGFRNGSSSSGNGRFFAAEGATSLTVVDLVTGQGVGSIPVSRWHTSVSASPDGRWVAGSIWKGRGTTVWELATQRRVAAFEDFGGVAVFSPDGGRLVVGTATEYVFIDTQSWQVIRRLPRESLASAIYGMPAFSADGRMMAVTHSLRQIHLVSPSEGETIAELDAPVPVRLRGLVFTRDGQRLAAATDTGEIQIWNLAQARKELSKLDLDWDQNEAMGPVANLTASVARGFWGGGALWLAGTGAALAMLVTISSLRRQRQLVGEYESLGALAISRRQALDAAQTHMLQSEKMKALGTLAAGIAHDFNNLLSVIRMASQLVRRDLKPEGAAGQNLEDIEQAVIQGKNLARSILGYSRTPASARQDYQINEVVSETVAMLSKPFLSGIVLTLELDSDAPRLSGDKSRLEQILLNLVVNANEAMKGQGKLTMATRVCTVARPGVLAPRPSGRYIEVSVRDSGPGISQEILPRIFDPFFTTKSAGVVRGTGLGLTSVFMIAQQDGWGLAVETIPGQGTEFHVLLRVDDVKPAV